MSDAAIKSVLKIMKPDNIQLLFYEQELGLHFTLTSMNYSSSGITKEVYDSLQAAGTTRLIEVLNLTITESLLSLKSELEKRAQEIEEFLNG